ncbi:MAG: RDD family protein, partial [Deltaproteobacteria bacterium]|nr:RDD family protein [Deltaproteobacteria bacterium]
MNLYYEEGDQQVGPVGKTELQALIRAKKLNARSLVWQEGMESWQELGVFIRKCSGKGGQANSPEVPVRQSICSECRQTFAEDEMIRFQESWVCAGCKPVFIQKIKEGVSVAGAMEYAGFWIRFGAIVIDAFIIWILNLILFIPLGILIPKSPEDSYVFFSFMPLMIIAQYAIPAAYDTWFVGKYGATLGKMACNIKVVVEDGSRLTYMRAFGRHFAKWLSSMILAIGFI